MGSTIPREKATKSHSSDTRITRLENGLRVASQEAFGQYSTIGVFVDAGSRYEVNYTSGVSHLLQKLSFQSTANFHSREELMQELDKYGGVFECQRFRDIVMYSLSVFSFAVPQAVKVLADAIWRPQLKESELESERQTIKFELEGLIGPNVEPLLIDLIHQAAYRDNTLGLPSLPSEETLEKVSAHELKTYLASHYSPSRMVLAGVNVDHDNLVQLVREHFAVVANSTAWGGVESLPVDQSVAQYTGGKAMVSREGPAVIGPNPLPDLTHVVLAMESSSYLEEDFYAFAVLNALMGGGGSFSAGGPGKGMFTQLYLNVLNQHHWVYSAQAQNHAYSDSGIFCILGSAHPSDARNLTEVLCQQFYSMTFSPKETDLTRAKKQLQSAMMMNLESRLIVFEDIGRQVLGQGKKLSPKELYDKIEAVTCKDVQRAGERMMGCGNPALAALGDLTNVPSMTDVTRALSNKGHLPKKSQLFPFR